MRRCVVQASGSLLLSRTSNWMSLKMTSTGLSSGLALGRLIQCSPSARITCRVTAARQGWAGSWSSTTHSAGTWAAGYQSRTRRRNAQTSRAPLPGRYCQRTRPVFTS